MADASWKEGNFQVAAHVIANLYTKKVEIANSPIMNQYAGSFTTVGADEKLSSLCGLSVQCRSGTYIILLCFQKWSYLEVCAGGR